MELQPARTGTGEVAQRRHRRGAVVRVDRGERDEHVGVFRGREDDVRTRQRRVPGGRVGVDGEHDRPDGTLAVVVGDAGHDGVRSWSALKYLADAVISSSSSDSVSVRVRLDVHMRVDRDERVEVQWHQQPAPSGVRSTSVDITRQDLNTGVTLRLVAATAPRRRQRQEAAMTELGTRWHRVEDEDVPGEGRVLSVEVDGRSVALSRCGEPARRAGNHCPHQGGPLGEGSIEKGLLRCPWHGYDYDPITGRPPAASATRCRVIPSRNAPTACTSNCPSRAAAVRTVADTLVETLVAFGITHVFGMVGHSNLGFADALRRAEGRGEITYIGIRHEGAAAFAASAYGKLTGRPGDVLRDRRSGLDATC